MNITKVLSAMLIGIFMLTLSGCGNDEEIQALLDKGIKQHNLGNDVEAINLFNKVIKLSPENSEAWAYLGNAYNAIQNYDKAIDSLKKAVDINPNNAYAWICLGSGYNNKEDYDNAIECIKKALRISNLSNDENSSAQSILGVAYANKGELERGLEYLNEATKLNSLNEYAWENIEIIKKKLAKQ